MPEPTATALQTSPDALTPAERRLLLRVAEDSIAYGLSQHAPLAPDPAQYPPALRVPTATFVTLQRHGQLRGCIGTLEAVRPLVIDVAHNAFAAAFHDPRFPRLGLDELLDLHIHLSLLSPAEPLPFTSEADLIAKLRPGVDGLILIDGQHRGTFLPAVWENLPDPARFLAHLKMKAGLPATHWSDRLRVLRYTATSIP